jgi:hypothetical protein
MDDLKTLDRDSLEKWLKLQEGFLREETYVLSTFEEQMRGIKEEKQEILLNMVHRKKEIRKLKREFSKRKKNEKRKV